SCTSTATRCATGCARWRSSPGATSATRSTGWSSGWRCGPAICWRPHRRRSPPLSRTSNREPSRGPSGGWSVRAGTRDTGISSCSDPYKRDRRAEASSRREEETMADSHQMFIGGEWVNSSDGGTRDIISPHTGAVMATVQEGTAEDTNRAVAAAKKAFDETWFDSTPKDRQVALLK